MFHRSIILITGLPSLASVAPPTTGTKITPPSAISCPPSPGITKSSKSYVNNHIGIAPPPPSPHHQHHRSGAVSGSHSSSSSSSSSSSGGKKKYLKCKRPTFHPQRECIELDKIYTIPKITYYRKECQKQKQPCNNPNCKFSTLR